MFLLLSNYNKPSGSYSHVTNVAIIKLFCFSVNMEVKIHMSYIHKETAKTVFKALHVNFVLSKLSFEW